MRPDEGDEEEEEEVGGKKKTQEREEEEERGRWKRRSLCLLAWSLTGVLKERGKDVGGVVDDVEEMT